MKKPDFAKADETEKRQREVQLIVNIIQPDPEYQPSFISDEATLLDCLGNDEDFMAQRLKEYFGNSFDFDIGRTPIWQLVDRLKNAYLGWPDRPFIPEWEKDSRMSSGEQVGEGLD